MELFYNNNIFFYLTPTSSHLHALQAEHRDRDTRLALVKDDNGSSDLKGLIIEFSIYIKWKLGFAHATHNFN